MDGERIPAKLEVSGLLRRTQALGGFAMVLHKGEPESGTILAIILDNQGLGTLFERMPQADGGRKWTVTKSQSVDNNSEFNDYLDRRIAQDRDVWIVELTIADGERLILNAP
jgi:hypothetical protein